MNEEMADFSREPGWYSIEYGSGACKLTFSPSRLRRGRFGKVKNGPMHHGGITSEKTLLGQEKVLKRRPWAVGQVCKGLRRVSEKVEKWLGKDGGLWLFERDSFGDAPQLAYDERYEFEPIISELAPRIVAIEVIWNSRV